MEATQQHKRRGQLSREARVARQLQIRASSALLQDPPQTGRPHVRRESASANGIVVREIEVEEEGQVAPSPGAGKAHGGTLRGEKGKEVAHDFRILDEVRPRHGRDGSRAMPVDKDVEIDRQQTAGERQDTRRS